MELECTWLPEGRIAHKRFCSFVQNDFLRLENERKMRFELCMYIWTYTPYVCTHIHLFCNCKATLDVGKYVTTKVVSGVLCWAPHIHIYIGIPTYTQYINVFITYSWSNVFNDLNLFLKNRFNMNFKNNINKSISIQVLHRSIPI
jgi:hypothetical protein